MEKINEYINLISSTFKKERLEEILKRADPFRTKEHYLYPADERGNHLKGFFLLEPIVKHSDFVELISEDIIKWIKSKSIDFDLIFSPAQDAVKKLTEYIASSLGKKKAYLEYLPTGRFGDKLVEGEIKEDDRVIVFNAVAVQGGCIGNKLPKLVENFKGKVVAAATFAKGMTPLIQETEKKHGDNFYSTIQIQVPVYSPDTCPLCQAEIELIPWTKLLETI
mgnify:CR=1 FL=1